MAKNDKETVDITLGAPQDAAQSTAQQESAAEQKIITQVTQNDTVWLTNRIEAPIHVKGKNPEGSIITIKIAPTDVVEVHRDTLKIGGIKQFIDQKKLEQVDPPAAALIKKEHAGIISSDEE